MKKLLVLLPLILLLSCGGGEGPSMRSIDYPIVVSADDGHFYHILGQEWRSADTGSTVIFGRIDVGPVHSTYRMFVRFPLTILAGSTINSATLVFEASSGVGSFATDIKLIDADNCGDINSFAADQSDMDFTGDEVSWTPDTWTGHEEYSSDDIATLLQAYIDRAGYLQGQYIGLLLTEGDAEDNEMRIAYAWDDATAAAPILRVIYTPIIGSLSVAVKKN